MLDRPYGKGMSSNLREVSKEGLDVIFSFKRPDCVYNCRLLISLPLTKATNVEWLDKMGLMGGVLYYPNMVYFGLEDKIRSIVASSAVD